jgi:hypothetical protein
MKEVRAEEWAEGKLRDRLLDNLRLLRASSDSLKSYLICVYHQRIQTGITGTSSQTLLVTQRQRKTTYDLVKGGLLSTDHGLSLPVLERYLKHERGYCGRVSGMWFTRSTPRQYELLRAPSDSLKSYLICVYHQRIQTGITGTSSQTLSSVRVTRR